MATNRVTKVKTVLGVMAMTSLAALTPPVDAKTLNFSQSYQNILRQAKLNLDNQNQQSEETPAYSSFKQFDGSFKMARPFCCNFGCGRFPLREDSNTGASYNPDSRAIVTTDDEGGSRPKTGGCY